MKLCRPAHVCATLTVLLACLGPRAAAGEGRSAGTGSPQGSTYEFELQEGEHTSGSGTTLYKLGAGPGDNVVTFNATAETIQPYCCGRNTTPTVAESLAQNGDGTSTITITATAPINKDLFPGGLFGSDGTTSLTDGAIVIGGFNGDPLDWTPTHTVTAATVELFAGDVSLTGGPDSLAPADFFGAPGAWSGKFTVVYTGAAGLGIDTAEVKITYRQVTSGGAGTLQFSSPSYGAAEGAGSATIAVSRAGGSAGAVSVHYATSNGSALAGSDYAAASGTLSWASGDSAPKSFTVPLFDDGANEGDETVNLALSAAAGGAALGSPSTATLTIHDDDSGPSGPCTPSATALCLAGGRFKVETTFSTPQGQSGMGQGVRLTSDTGYFWFFQSSNVEMVVKVLNACSFSQRFWVFAGGLTNVQVNMKVTDVKTGRVRNYSNPQGTKFKPVQDTGAFATCGAADTAASAAAEADPGAPWQLGQAVDPRAAADTTLTLGGGRFELHVNWKTPAGQSGQGHGVQLTADTGYFWFFQSTNVEMVVKVLDACSFSKAFWVFSGGLTNVQVEMYVVDTVTGATQKYTNPQSTQFQPLQDTAAFVTCNGFSEEPEEVEVVLPKPALSIDPPAPASGQTAKVRVEAPGASSVSLSASGDGCGSLGSQSTSGGSLQQNRAVGAFGTCSLTAQVAGPGGPRAFKSRFTVQPTTVHLPAIEVVGGDFVPGPLPATGGGPAIASISAPSTLITGGTADMRLTLSNPGAAAQVQRVLVQVPTAAGYAGHWEVAPRFEGQVAVVSLRLDSDFHPAARGSLPRRLQERFASQWDRMRDSPSVSVQLVGSGGAGARSSTSFSTQQVGEGSVEVALSWDSATDVDLHVVDPNNVEIYYGNKNADGGSLDLDSTCSGGPQNEHITWANPPSGEYTVRVDFYSDCPSGVPQQGKPANWTLTTTACGETKQFSGHFSAGEDDHGGGGSGVFVTKFKADCQKRVRGQAVYEDHAQTLTGLDESPRFMPIRYADIEVHRSDDDAVLAKGTTKADGTFDLRFANDGKPGYFVKVLASANNGMVNEAVQTEAVLSEVYSARSMGDIDETQTPNKEDVDVQANGAKGRAFNIFDMGVKGAELYRKHHGATPPRIVWQWTMGANRLALCPKNSCYHPIFNKIFVGSGSNGDSGYEDTVLLHEYGHFWANRKSATGVFGSAHSSSQRSSPVTAWSEGEATFFGQLAYGASAYIKTDGTPGGSVRIRYDTETLVDYQGNGIPLGTSDGKVGGNVSEAVVAAILRDLSDASNETVERTGLEYQDTLTLEDEVFDTFAYFYSSNYTVRNLGHLVELGAAFGPDLEDFLYGWYCRGHDNHGDSFTGVDGIVEGMHLYPFHLLPAPQPACQ